MEINVLNVQGKETGRTIALNDEVFGIEPNSHSVYLDVKQYLANQRQGTHKSKGRSELAGSTRKLGRQKGGGGARPGDIKSPVRVGGGRIFGPVPRDYGFKLNRKVKQLARKSALSYKAQNGKIQIVEALKFETPKTKEFVAFLQNFGVEGKKPLIILEDINREVLLSARNLPRVNVLTVSQLNTYAITDAQSLIFTEAAVPALEQIFKA